jgi:hypothetical protein
MAPLRTVKCVHAPSQNWKTPTERASLKSRQSIRTPKIVVSAGHVKANRHAAEMECFLGACGLNQCPAEKGLRRFTLIAVMGGGASKPMRC